MYLTRLLLDPSSSAVRHDLGDCHAMHARVMSGFGPVGADDSARETHGVLFRVEMRAGAAPELLVQSVTTPDWSRLPPGYLRTPSEGEGELALETKLIDAALWAVEARAVFRFRLCTNPARRIDSRSGPNGERRQGRRVPVVGEAARLAWLARRATAAGFELVDADGVVQIEHGAWRGWRPAAPQLPPITVAPVTFTGMLRVVDAAAFRMAVRRGLGPAKAYGCGLLSLALDAGREPPSCAGQKPAVR